MGSLALRLTLLILGSAQLACTREGLSPELAERGLATYANIAQAGYEDARDAARALEAAVDALVAAPSEQTLGAAREAWRAARVPYLQTETYRFYEGPIDRVELLVNTWPVDEAYVERTLADRERYPDLSPASLVELNAQEGETSISTGYHVLEFLLWGRDTRADAPGTRPASDFAGPAGERSRLYLKRATSLLVLHLSQVADAWSGPYRAALTAMPPKRALGLALRGMGALSGPELAGERLTVPYETRDQENEQSCFSDTTDQDIKLDARGVQNVCLGSYLRTSGKRVEGPGICALVGALDDKLGRVLRTDIAASVRAADRIRAPFDQALIARDDAPERLAIKHTIDALQVQTETITRALALLAERP